MMSDFFDDVGSDSSRRLSESLNALLARMGSAPIDATTSVFGSWDAIVGPQVSAHVSPTRLVGGTLHVDVDDPSWATQIRFLEAHIVTMINETTPTTVTGIEVHVKRAPKKR
ncbi:MAG: DciA family protein [Ilumatobacteraceae bacterium]